MRKIICYILILLIMIPLTSCSNKTEGYQLIYEDGIYYIVLSEDLIKKANIIFKDLSPSVAFQSINEMINDIKQGNFTEDELKHIAHFPKDEFGRIPICNIDELYEFMYPLCISECGIRWNGESYNFYFALETNERGSLSILTKEKMESFLKERPELAPLQTPHEGQCLYVYNSSYSYTKILREINGAYFYIHINNREYQLSEEEIAQFILVKYN